MNEILPLTGMLNADMHRSGGLQSLPPIGIAAHILLLYPITIAIDLAILPLTAIGMLLKLIAKGLSRSPKEM
jgi:hypothetical protein